LACLTATPDKTWTATPITRVRTAVRCFHLREAPKKRATIGRMMNATAEKTLRTGAKLTGTLATPNQMRSAKRTATTPIRDGKRFSPIDLFDSSFTVSSNGVPIDLKCLVGHSLDGREAG